MIGRKGAAGKVTIADEPSWTIDTAYYVVPQGGINLRFLAYQLEAAQLKGLDQSTAIPSLSRDDLNALTIRIAPIAEQQMIVDRLDALLRAVREGDGACDRAETQLEVFRASVLQRLVGLGAPEVAIGELGDVFVGATPPRDDRNNWEGGIPWVSSGEVAFCRIASTREMITDAGLGNRARRLHPPGTVLLAMIGEGKTRGQAAILDVAAAHNQNSAAIRLDPTKMTPEFLFYCLMARYESNRRRAGGSQQPALSGARVRELRVPCPPVEQQRERLRSIEGSLSDLADVELDLAMKRRSAAQLRSSLLSHAFSGRLVPQDPTDDPASDLINRHEFGSRAADLHRERHR